MSTTQDTFGLTQDDVRKAESRQSAAHGGNVPKGSDAALMQSIVDSGQKDKEADIAERQANLPLPDQPPQPSDWQSADGRTVNVGSGGLSDDVTAHGSGASTGLREPATASSEETAGGIGRLENGKVPSDAVTRQARGKADVETRQ